MRYIAISKDNTAFYTDWFDFENFWNPETMICVIDLAKDMITFGNCLGDYEWIKIEEDHL